MLCYDFLFSFRVFIVKNLKTFRGIASSNNSQVNQIRALFFTFHVFCIKHHLKANSLVLTNDFSFLFYFFFFLSAVFSLPSCSADNKFTRTRQGLPPSRSTHIVDSFQFCSTPLYHQSLLPAKA